ncbi:MAG: tRNA pseudouridine(55) synthase TruB, partial [Dokdonella sp.]
MKSARKAPIAWRDVNGILLLDKPSGVSSNHVLQTVRRMFRAVKAGHTGSLDPLATGLLPICFGEATKIAGLLIGSSKAYSTTAMLGQTRSTDDAEGELLVERPVPSIGDELIRRGLSMLTGEQTQIPPIYSAIKRDGERMYKRARRGETVDVPPRTVQVDRFELVANNSPLLDLEIGCGSGTYVRSLVRDLGEFLGCGAHVTALRRLWVEPFRDPAMFTLDQLETLAGQGMSALDETVLSVET